MIRSNEGCFPDPSLTEWRWIYHFRFPWGTDRRKVAAEDAASGTVRFLTEKPGYGVPRWYWLMITEFGRVCNGHLRTARGSHRGKGHRASDDLWAMCQLPYAMVIEGVPSAFADPAARPLWERIDHPGRSPRQFKTGWKIRWHRGELRKIIARIWKMCFVMRANLEKIRRLRKISVLSHLLQAG